MTAIPPADAEPPLVLTIDVGTSSVRTMLFDARGRPLEGVGARETYTVDTDASGAAEDDPDAALARVERCVDAALAQAGPLAEQIGAVAVDTLVSNLLGLDAGGRPITPLITYADTRNDADAAALRRELDERAVHERTGCMLRTSYWPARLAWLRRTRPEVFRRAARWATLGEYLELRLFGRCRMSTSVASWSGLLDRRRLVWDAPLLAALGVPEERLSPLADASEPLAGLLPEHAARWPALRDVPWFPAIGDGAAANLGSGCAAPGRVALTVGTTGALRTVLFDDQGPEDRRHAVPARVPDGLWCYRVDRRRVLMGGATSEGGNVYAWMRRSLQLGAPEEVERAVAGLPPDGHGLTVLPFFAGERSPGWAGDAKATITGMTLGTTPLEILRAALEAVAYRFALIAEGLIPSVADQRPATSDQLMPKDRSVSSQKSADIATGERSSFVVRRSSDEERSSSLIHPSSATIVASGGALLASPAWMQIIADVLGQPVVASAEAEATSRGAALLALEALGAIPSVESVPAATGETYAPDEERHERYRAALERQRALYRMLLGLNNTSMTARRF
ncbi:MAG TPA: gluconokinase [Roseiflexaceae bacterium]|nr:gluconokinase [Roseiflexaceae bacterium]